MFNLVASYRSRISILWLFKTEFRKRLRFQSKKTKCFTKKYSSYQELIDISWMASTYKDIDFDVRDYRLLFRDGVDPNPYFDSDWYMSTNQDVAKSSLDPLYHYVFFGESEGRKPNPLFDPIQYLLQNPGLKEHQDSILGHFLMNDIRRNHIVTEVNNRFVFESAKSVSVQYKDELRKTLNGKKIGVVIPVFNNWMMTERCIRAIETTIDYEFLQLFVFNDGSTDETLREIKRFPEVITINTPSKLGYIKTCNFAFSQLANFEYLFLLRNGTEPLDGFAINAFEVMATSNDCSIVGSRLFFPDGRLHASGGIVSRFGDTIHFGEYDESQAELYNVTRKVDYAPLWAGLIRNSDFSKVDGFDEAYVFGGYEDVDLAFKLRSIGKSIYVCSDSNVINYGSEFKIGEIPFFGSQVKDSNKFIFREKWNVVLKCGY